MGRDVPPGAGVVTATTFDGRLAEQARQRPDAPAVLFGGETCSYAELDRRVARMAGQLVGAGVGPADRVVLVADNSADHLAAAFAVWRAGGVLVTIYPSSTEAELAFAIERAEPVAVVAGTRVVGTVRAAAGGRPVAELDGTGALAGSGAGAARGRRTRLRPDRPRRAGAHLLHVRLDRPPQGGHAPPRRAARCRRRVRTRVAPRPARRHPGLPADGLGLRPGDDVDGRAARPEAASSRWPGPSPRRCSRRWPTTA